MQLPMVPLMIAPVFIVAFTGNRPKDLEGRRLADLEAARPRLQEAFERFQAKAAELGGVIHLFSSAAEGADAIACELAAEMGIPVHIILPFAEEQFREDFTEETWPRSQAIIERARRGENGGSLRTLSSSSPRNDAYAEANHLMLKWADAVIALTNGEETKLQGGASNLIAKAESIDTCCLSINTRALEDELEIRHFDQFSEAIDRHSGLSMLQRLKQWADKAPEPATSSGQVDFEQIHARLESSANFHKSQTSQGLQSALWLHGIASIIAGLGVSYALAGCPGYKWVLLVLSIVELGLIITAEWIHKKHHHNHHAEAWLFSRYAAELLRGAKIHVIHGDPLDPPIARQHPIWRRFHSTALLRHPQLAERSNREDLEAEKADYLRNRLQDQVDYFIAQRDLAQPKAQTLNRKIKALTYAAITTVSLAILYKLGHKLDFFSHHVPWLELFLYLLPIALPLLAGIYSALRISTDVARRAIRYDHMAELLNQATARVQTAPTSASLSETIMQTEEVLLEELNEFLLVHKVSLEH